MRVMVIDDDEHVLFAISALIRSQGHEVIGFSSPCQCPLYATSEDVCIADQSCAEVLLSDKNMPIMSGFEFIKLQITKKCKTVEKHLAMMSGAWSSEDLNTAKQLGCKIFSKPINENELFEWLDECRSDVAQLQNCRR